MKIYDFDAKFFDYAQTWLAIHAGLTEKQAEESYNQIMQDFLNAPAKWLDGAKPGEYFNRYDQPKDLIKLIEEYDKRDIGMPEPLYARIVELGDVCAEALTRIAANADKSESLRASAIALLRDMEADAPCSMYIDFICNSDEPNELSELAADILPNRDESVVDELLARYDGATEYAQMLILEICCHFPRRERVQEMLIQNLLSNSEMRAFYASLLGDYGDERAIEPLKRVMELSDLGYLDYIEVRNAVEALGGDVGEERTFYGDPDYEAMRNM